MSVQKCGNHDCVHSSSSLRIYYNRGECLAIQTAPLMDTDEITEIVNRLGVVTRGCEVNYLCQHCSVYPNLRARCLGGPVIRKVKMQCLVSDNCRHRDSSISGNGSFTPSESEKRTQYLFNGKK